MLHSSPGQGELELFEEQVFASTAPGTEMSSGTIPQAGHLHTCRVVAVASRATSQGWFSLFILNEVCGSLPITVLSGEERFLYLFVFRVVPDILGADS